MRFIPSVLMISILLSPTALAADFGNLYECIQDSGISTSIYTWKDAPVFEVPAFKPSEHISEAVYLVTAQGDAFLISKPIPFQIQFTWLKEKWVLDIKTTSLYRGANEPLIFPKIEKMRTYREFKDSSDYSRRVGIWPTSQPQGVSESAQTAMKNWIQLRPDETRTVEACREFLAD